MQYKVRNIEKRSKEKKVFFPIRSRQKFSVISEPCKMYS